MFILAQQATVQWPIKYSSPKDGGGYEQHEFKGRFKLPSQPEVDELFTRLSSAARGELGAQAGTLDQEIVDKYFEGWPDNEVRDAQGNAIASNPVNRKVLLELPGMRVAVVRAFMQTLNGAAEAKN
ncbi:MAG TPA: hypothetical protein DDX06_04465 [Curvibacter sp.]|nr:hypothetical protein [Curvibacter sp.]